MRACHKRRRSIRILEDFNLHLTKLSAYYKLKLHIRETYEAEIKSLGAPTESGRWWKACGNAERTNGPLKARGTALGLVSETRAGVNGRESVGFLVRVGLCQSKPIKVVPQILSLSFKRRTDFFI